MLEDIDTARAAAARCDLPRAIAIGNETLARARKEWPPGHEGFVILHLDLATWLNERFEFGQAHEHALEAESIVKSSRGSESPLYALASQNEAVALSGMNQYDQAETILAADEAIFARGNTPEDLTNLLNVQMALANLAFARGQLSAGLAVVDRAEANLARMLPQPVSLRVKAGLSIADARRRMLDVRGARVALDRVELDLKSAPVGQGRKRLSLVKAAVAYEEGRLGDALNILNDASQAQTDPCDLLAETDIEARRGAIYMVRRELPEASRAYTQALLALAETNLRRNPREPEIVYGLAVIAGMSRKFDEASALFDRSAALFRNIEGQPTESEAITYLEKAQMLGLAGKGEDAVKAARDAMGILSQGVSQSPLTDAYAHAALGLALFHDGQFDLARKELSEALGGFEAVRGSASFDLAPGLDALGEMALASGLTRDAIDYFTRAADVQRQWGGSSALALGSSLSRLGVAQDNAGQHGEGLTSSADAVAILQSRLELGEGMPWNDADVERAAARSILTSDLEMVSSRAGERTLLIDQSVIERMLADVQLANATRTGAAIAQMTQSLSQLDSLTGEMLRQRNDLSAEWRAVQDEVMGLLAVDARIADERRKVLLVRQGEVVSRLRRLDQTLVARDPSVDLIIKSKIARLAAIQSSIRPNEAAVAVVTAADATYVVIIRKDQAGTYRTSLTTKQLAASVDALRASLDKSRWREELPAYDTQAAYSLFHDLLEPGMPFLTTVDSLLIVNDGALSTLPLSVLLTAPTAPIEGVPEDYTALPWLIDRFALSTYPSLASIVTLRDLARQVGAQDTFLGVGAPQFEGRASEGGDMHALREARTDTAFTDLASLRLLSPLPDAREEILSIADALGKKEKTLLMGPDATELRFRQEPLEDYSVILFATHGLIAGRLSGNAEPALALTPPAAATLGDDGLLDASEVAMLRLRANWVILSACNTAAGDRESGAEPLSGLAKAFFYAGTRSLLVTHWPVSSRAATKLTVETVRRAAAGEDPAKALREAALGFIRDDDHSLRTHPYFWAPYALVGG
ncbi:CHAT domain-containing tetratricopeptide repeat protein [Novosphingobium sp. PhB55]|uniref:CHAT domain-containing tetratricopeptide repeat protein n=1 Tax=Novosphingobium sp. PhB55 TaxID=2485106 RepID=UPI00141701FD|nr:CHAT domain-containing tetratricopeptide repeat protein [Novosphingobium sp. PhB55]